VAYVNAPAAHCIAHNLDSTRHVSISDTLGGRVSVTSILTSRGRSQRPTKPRRGHPRPGRARPVCLPSTFSPRGAVGGVLVASEPTTSRRRKPHRRMRKQREHDDAATTERLAASRHAHGGTAPARCARPASVTAQQRRITSAIARSEHEATCTACIQPCCEEGARSIAVRGRTLKNRGRSFCIRLWIGRVPNARLGRAARNCDAHEHTSTVSVTLQHDHSTWSRP
jgi:hypothetical protein